MPKLKYHKLENTPSQKKKTRSRRAEVGIHQERKKKFTEEISLINSNGREAQSLG
mgnify:CR=1 FL=1